MIQQIRRWNEIHAILMLAAAMVAIAVGTPDPMLIMAVGSFALLFAMGYRHIAHLKPWGGLANWVTMFRLIALLLVVWQAARLDAVIFVAACVLIIAGDGIDGYLARKYHQETPFGAALDLEVDALFAALIALLAWQWYNVGIWVLVAGLLRYGFVILLLVLGWNQRPKVHLREGKTIAVLFFLALLTPFLLPLAVSWWILLVASLAIIYSFVREFVLLARR
ncbi:MAG: CDP-alcohol phosphatidyltransferase family protein [Saprospiraceae bacterium]|nr:CDP-alcohol phosphatidyltransferase family protein [Saprospiraceae bacterium]